MKKLALFILAGMLPLAAFAGISQAMNPHTGPLCTMQNLMGANIIKFECDRFQSKGDLDSITPQVKIISPEPGEVVDYDSLAENGNGQKLLPVRIVITPEFDLDFTKATNAGTQYAVLPQVDSEGHAHAYLLPEIAVTLDGDVVTDVTFVGNDNRADLVGGFCVFQAPEVQTADFQVVSVMCPLQGADNMDDGPYRVIVDFTEHSHGSRIKGHPRHGPPGAEVSIILTNTP